ncbi:uncharacterized protein DFL_004540 [Arthrobotrys flagrans]|uniref:Uncharacterized protein n=1 Tax=Arthrobotrys flagrans TaxID=97331 RepID=A0A437A575_ARTFL|nr:hypothetical protein DFL_004540 [Arthrobotrys flagrans]
MKRTTSIRLQSNLTRANSGKDGRQLLDAIADVHYFISVPEERPSHSTFERGTKVGLFLKEDTGRIRIRFHDAVNPKNCALSGDISILHLEFGNDQECFVRAEIDYGEDHGVSLGSDWMVAAPDERNDGMHNWRPFCIDLYFWKHSMADYFVRIVEEYQKRLQAQKAHIQQAQAAEAKLKAVSPIREQPPSRTPSNRSSQLARTPEPEMQLKTRTSNIEDEDDEEMFKKNITSVDCLDSHNGEIFPISGGIMECRVIKNQVKKTTKIRVSAPIEGGYLKLCYTLTDRSFPYQLPESTVQVRFMLVEKSITANPGANIDNIIDAPPLDSPIFQFEQDDHAQIFLECLRGEQLLLNSIVDWVRCTRELKEGETSTAGPHPANFTCADDRRVQLWENELGFINIVFHRQFHLVSAFVSPSTQVEAEAEASTLKVSGIKIRKLEQSPTLDAKEPWRTEGSPAILKLRFAGPEHVVSFRDAVLRHRDATAMMYPEVAKTLAKSIAHESPGTNNVPPPPPPEFRHHRAMSASGGVPPPPTSPPQQYPASPQSPPAHQTSFPGYGLTHSQSVRINRPPPLPMFPGQPATYVPGSINSPRYNAQPSPMTGTFSSGNISTFPITTFPSPPGANATMAYKSPAAVASATLPQIQPMSNPGYFPATITPMTPGLPSAKFPPPLQTSMIITSSQAQAAQTAQQQPPGTPIREHMRKNSFATRNDTIQESTQNEPVELPASFPDAPPYEAEPRKEREDRDSLMIRRFPKDDDIAEEEEEAAVSSGYNPLGGNVSIPIAPVTARATGGGEREQGGGGKMSRVWKKLK